MKIKLPKTAKEIRPLIIWAMYEIDEYKDFIKLCEKQIKLIQKKRKIKKLNKSNGK